MSTTEQKSQQGNQLANARRRGLADEARLGLGGAVLLWSFSVLLALIAPGITSDGVVWIGGISLLGWLVWLKAHYVLAQSKGRDGLLGVVLGLLPLIGLAILLMLDESTSRGE